jgi:hypothetical protein
MEVKKCYKCQNILPLTSFAKHKGKSDGLQERCNSCRQKHYKDTGHITHRNNDIKRKYNVTTEWYENKFKEQNGLCEICNKPQLHNKRLAIDHNHNSGKARGLLCDVCNRAIGMLNDSIEILESATNYLRKYHND